MLETALVTLIEGYCPSVYPIIAPKGYSTPCVVYQRLHTQPFNELAGFSGAQLVWMQVKVYDTIYGGARTLADQIRTAITEWESDAFQSVTWHDDADMIDDTTQAILYATVNRFAFLVIE